MPETETPDVRAQAKWVRTSARKARLVAEHIRGRSVPEARAVLAFTPRAAARELEKVLRSAVANAESRDDLRWLGDDLVVSSVYVDEGPTLKRWRARARGRVARLRKRACHITVILTHAESVTTSQPTRRTAQAAQKLRPRRPSVRRPKAEKPEAEARGAEPAAEPPAATAEKPKRRAPVRRKKTEEKES